jgi:hypothetical protein
MAGVSDVGEADATANLISALGAARQKAVVAAHADHVSGEDRQIIAAVMRALLEARRDLVGPMCRELDVRHGLTVIRHG